MVGATGFEPATSWSQTKCSSQAELRSDQGGTPSSHNLPGMQAQPRRKPHCRMRTRHMPARSSHFAGKLAKNDALI